MDFGVTKCTNCGDKHEIKIEGFPLLSLEEQEKALDKRTYILCTSKTSDKVSFYLYCINCSTLILLERKNSFFKGEHFKPVEKIDTSNYSENDWKDKGEEIHGYFKYVKKIF